MVIAPPTSSIQWKPLVVCPQPEILRGLRGALQQFGVPKICHAAEYPALEAMGAVARQQGCNVCFLDVVSDQEHALKLIGEVAALMPVVAVNSRNDADLILRCLRRGAREFLSDSSPEQVAGVLDRLTRTVFPAPEQSKGQIYCVIPGKSGCGASTVAAHLAIQMHAHGARVLLVDTDPLTASIGFMLKLKSEFHVGDVLRDWKRMDEGLWSRFTTAHSGVDVLLAPESPSLTFEWNRAVVNEVCAFWRKRYDSVVIDTSDVRSAVETHFAAVSDQILLVSTNELAALHAARRALEYLDHTAKARERARLVVNRYNPAAGLKRDDLKAALHMEPFAILSNDYEVMQGALLDGKPAASGSSFAASLRAFSQKLRLRRKRSQLPGSVGGRFVSNLRSESAKLLFRLSTTSNMTPHQPMVILSTGASALRNGPA